MDLGGSGDRKKTVLIVGALVLIAGVCVVSVIIVLSGSEEMTAGWDEVHFLCLETNAHFMVKYQELPQDYLESSALGQRVFLDCPKCGKKNCAAPTIRCPDPKCGKHYPKYYKDAALGKAMLNAKCPHCGTVPHEWDKKHRKK